MIRQNIISLIISFFAAHHLIADMPVGKESAFQNALRIQTAIEKARGYLHFQGKAHKAVEILEANMGLINGHTKYLNLLRDAYRSYIQDLYLANRDDVAQLYLQRLTILDPSAAKKLVRRPAPPIKQPKAKAAPKKPFSFPVLSKSQEKQLLVPAELAIDSAIPGSKTKMPAPSTARAKTVDPFDAAFQIRELRVPHKKNHPGDDLLKQAEAAFAKKNFGLANDLFTKSYQTGLTFSQSTRELWAYCKMYFVVHRINKDDVTTRSLLPLKKQVEQAIAMAPRLSTTGNWLLKEIGKRATNSTPAKSATFALRHMGAAGNGWQLTETDHFQIYHRQSKQRVEEIAKIAESTRLAKYRKWFGHDGKRWQSKCVIYLYSSAKRYQDNTHAPATSPGHARIEIDTKGSKVVSRVIHLAADFGGLLTIALPKEITHVVMAGQFGNRHVPLWADVGMAAQSETAGRLLEYRQALHELFKVRQLIRLEQLIKMQKYPSAKQIPAYFAQSVFLVQWLSQKRGEIVFTQFLRDSLQHGYANALQKHYQIGSFEVLQSEFDRQMLTDLKTASISANR